MAPWIPILLVACGGAGNAPLPADAPAFDRLPPEQHALRASLALRGVPPTEAELDRVSADADALPELVDDWLHDPRFGHTVKDLYAEVFRVRADTLPILPPMGPLANRSESAMFEAISEAPLHMVEQVVTDDRPLTDILTDPHVYGSGLLAEIYGLEGHDPDGPEIQAMTWTDGRPASGLLSSSALWMRHEANGSNYNRGRANHVSRMFLCDDIGSRDVVLPDGIDLSDDLVVADLVQTEPACAGCHAELDPLAAHFAGFKPNQRRMGVFMAYNLHDCGLGYTGFSTEDWCYPVQLFDAEWVDPVLARLQPPAFEGQATDGLVELGQRIAADPRFATCQTRRFASFLLQKELRAVPEHAVEPWREAFVTSGMSARELARAVVLSDEFAAVRVHDPQIAPLAAGLLTMRPEQYARWLEELTGFTWWAVGGCTGTAGCWPLVDLSRSDLYGFRAMAGGTDGYNATRPTHTATPTRVLVLQRLAAEAAGHVVEHDFSSAPGARLLLTRYDGSDASVDAELDALWTRLHAEAIPMVERDGLRALYDGALSRSAGDDREAWKVVLTAMFQDPGVVFY